MDWREAVSVWAGVSLGIIDASAHQHDRAGPGGAAAGSHVHLSCCVPPTYFSLQ